MSIKSWVQTGLTEWQWEMLWAQLASSPKTQIEALKLGYENWREAVISEGANRQFIHYATTGKHISLRKGIAEVVQEMRQDARCA
jgi:hypothetical protein